METLLVLLTKKLDCFAFFEVYLTWEKDKGEIGLYWDRECKRNKNIEIQSQNGQYKIWAVFDRLRQKKLKNFLMTIFFEEWKDLKMIENNEEEFHW